MATYTSTLAGPPVSGFYTDGDTVTDASGTVWTCVVTGFAGFGQSGTAVFSPVTRKVQGAPTAMTTAASITIAGILTGIITGTHTAGATVAYTLPTGALTDAGGTFAVGDSFDWSIINLSAAAADTLTITAADGHTFVGAPIVQSVHASTGTLYGTAAMLRTRKTAANTFVTYRIG